MLKSPLNTDINLVPLRIVQDILQKRIGKAAGICYHTCKAVKREGAMILSERLRLLLAHKAVPAFGLLALLWAVPAHGAVVLQGAHYAAVPMAAPRQPMVKKDAAKATPKPTPKPTATPKPSATPKPAATAKTTVNVQRTQPEPEYQAAEPVIDTSRAGEGLVFVAYQMAGSNHKVIINNGSQNATYNIKSDGSTNRISLSLGEGTYTITLMQNAGGSRYMAVKAASVYFDGGAAAIPATEQPPANVDSRFLMASNEINWNQSQAAIKYAATLAETKNTTKDKVVTIYSFIIANIRYNYDVVGKLPSGYLPDIDTTYSTRKGICYDFSALFGGMLRSQGIPAKLVKGSSTLVNGYHAWNEVYIDGKWYVVDTSSDSIYYEYKTKVSMFKSTKDYKTKYET